jgi:hypothetical protein
MPRTRVALHNGMTVGDAPSPAAPAVSWRFCTAGSMDPEKMLSQNGTAGESR